MARDGQGSERPRPLKWRPVFSFWSMLWGLFLGLGSAVLMQQYGLRVLTRGNLIECVVAAVVVALVAPSLARVVAVRRYNRVLHKAGLA